MDEYVYDGTYYSVKNIPKEKIPSHIERVLFYWEQSGANIDQQKEMLEKSVEEGSAYMLVHNEDSPKVFLYLTKYDANNYIAHALWFERKVFLAILCYHLRRHTQIRAIFFIPHKLTDDFPFKFLVEEGTIGPCIQYGYPVKVDLYSQKCENLYKYYLVRNNVTGIAYR